MILLRSKVTFSLWCCGKTLKLCGKPENISTETVWYDMLRSDSFASMAMYKKSQRQWNENQTCAQITFIQIAPPRVKVCKTRREECEPHTSLHTILKIKRNSENVKFHRHAAWSIKTQNCDLFSTTDAVVFRNNNCPLTTMPNSRLISLIQTMNQILSKF